MTRSSMHQMVFVPTMIPTFKAPVCTNTQVRTKLKKQTNRNWASNGQTLPNDDQPLRGTDNKSSEGFNSLITHSVPCLHVYGAANEWKQSTGPDLIHLTMAKKNILSEWTSSITLWNPHFLPFPLVHKNKVYCYCTPMCVSACCNSWLIDLKWSLKLLSAP